MRKARIAPMIKQEEHELLITPKHTPVKKSVYDIVKEIKPKTKRKWKVLKNVMRFQASLRKNYQEINHELIKEKNMIRLPRKSCMDCLLDGNDDSHGKRKNLRRGSIRNKENSKELIRYFIHLSMVEDEKDKILDFELLENLFNSGCDINVVDKHGQSILHEVARIWHPDVAQFLIDHGSIPNHPDELGRTPLHVAAAVDYPEMVLLLLSNGADINCRTYEENQSPIHYAAKNDATNSLKVLLDNGANMNDLDYKERTPLQLAAELDRSLTAQLLIEEGAPAGGYDKSKMATLVLLIEKMPNVALQALDQFNETDRANRKEFFYLNFLLPPTEDKGCHAKSPLEVIVENNQQQVLLHPVFQRLIEVKWQRMAKYGAWLYFITNLLLSILWTSLLCLLPKHHQNVKTEDTRILQYLFEALAVATLMIWVSSEIREFWKARKKNSKYKEWRISKIEKDLEFVHKRWPEEKLYLIREIKVIEDMKSSYIRDYWNYFDWLTYFLMIATAVCHVINIKHKTAMTNNLLRTVGSIMIIFLWVRMLKYARPFKMFGLFVVMLSHVVVDTVKLLFLSMHFFIPYAAAFWTTFGVDNVEGYTLKSGDLFYNLFQMAVVGDYNFDKLKGHSQIMSRLLVGTYIFFGGIICLNLFIALMSDTFQRVYDNAKANAAMQRAATIVGLEADISTAKLRKHREWITKNCAPECLYYDDDMTDPSNNDLKRLTHQIKAKVDEVREYLEDQLGKSIPYEENNSKTTSKNAEHTQNKKTDSNNLNEGSVSIDTKQILQHMSDFKAEYYKSMIQTRAEIAGLGLMLKELIEQNAAQKERRKKMKKRTLYKQLGQSMQLNQSEIKEQESLHYLRSDTETKTLHNQENNDENEPLDYQDKLTAAVTANVWNNTLDSNITDSLNSSLAPDETHILISQNLPDEDNTNNVTKEDNDIESKANSLTHILISQNIPEKDNRNNLSKEDDDIEIKANQNILNAQNLIEQSGNSFFEGYTHPPQHSSNDRLIASTWNSIFTKILDSKTGRNKPPEEITVRLPALHVSPRLQQHTVDLVEEEDEEEET